MKSRFCPECIPAAAGILIIPAAAPIVGGLIPPPPGLPALAIGPDGAPTPTGPTSGTQPSGDPRTQNPTGSALETTTTKGPSTSDAPTGTASESSISPPEVTGSCRKCDSPFDFVQDYNGGRRILEYWQQ